MILEKKYILAITVQEAIEQAITNKGNFKYLAGGTDVMVNRFQGNETSSCLIDLTKIAEREIYLPNSFSELVKNLRKYKDE